MTELQLLKDRITDLEDDKRVMYQELGTLLDHMLSVSEKQESVAHRDTGPREQIPKLQELRNAREMHRRQP